MKVTRTADPTIHADGQRAAPWATRSSANGEATASIASRNPKTWRHRACSALSAR